jgi:uncharacterized protein
MPVTTTYPGVYIEEIPSGVRTITGVATAITAFIGRALRGPVNQAVTINSFGDFERICGGLWVESTLGYAVRDFYLNGGSQAVIVRLFHPYFAAEEARDLALAAATAVATAAKGATTIAAAKTAAAEELANYIEEPQKNVATAVNQAIARLADDADIKLVSTTADAAIANAVPQTKASVAIGSSTPLILAASSEGAWGNNLRVRIDRDVLTDDELPQSYKDYEIGEKDLFNLTVRDTSTGVTEVFRNVTVKSGPRQIDKVLSNESNLVRVASALPDTPPEATDQDLTATEKEIVPFSVEDIKGNKRSLKVTTLGSNGGQLEITDFTGVGKESRKQGLYALEQVDIFNLLCLPLYSENVSGNGLLDTAKSYCEKRRAFLLVDPPKNATAIKEDDLGVRSKNAAIFYPSLRQPNSLKNNQIEAFAPCGAIAGVFARTDAERGVWKAPAGLEATLVGVSQLSVSLTDAENGQLNQLGINCIRSMPGAGPVIWGARTMQGNDRLASEWKYISVRRLALYIQESLYRGTQWVVFEPNDEALWAQIRLNLGAFMHNLFRRGAFQGKSPREAYFVKCDSETTTQNDINLGIVNIKVGFAPLKPAEFAIVQLQQMAGQIQS